MKLRERLLIPLLLSSALRPALAKDDPPLLQMLLPAMQQSDLTHGQTSPFTLDVDFVAQFKEPMQGHLKLDWAAKDRWRREVVMGDLRQVEIRKGDWRYMSRNAMFTPLRVGELFGLLGLEPSSQSWTASKDKHRVVRGIEAVCIQAKPVNEAAMPAGAIVLSHDFCVSHNTNDILSDESDGQKKEFDDYIEFGSHRYPRKLRLQVNGAKLITAEVKNLSLASFDESHFAPPAGAVARRDCDDLKHPVVINAPEVAFSPAARANGGGELTASMTVDVDGSVSDVELSGSSGIPLDSDALKALRTYKFKPAMCGSEPVVADVDVEVDYKIQ